MKKVLIVGAGIIEKPNAAGITLKSIFSEVDSKLLMGVDWQSLRIFQEFQYDIFLFLNSHLRNF